MKPLRPARAWIMAPLYVLWFALGTLAGKLPAPAAIGALFLLTVHGHTAGRLVARWVEAGEREQRRRCDIAAANLLIQRFHRYSTEADIRRAIERHRHEHPFA